MKKHRVPLYSDNIYFQACFVLFSSPSWSEAWPWGCGCPWHHCSLGRTEQFGGNGGNVKSRGGSAWHLRLELHPLIFSPARLCLSHAQCTGTESGAGAGMGGGGSIPAARALEGGQSRPHSATARTGTHEMPEVSWHSSHRPFTTQFESNFHSSQGGKMPTDPQEEKGEQDPMPSIPCPPGGAALAWVKVPILTPQEFSAILTQRFAALSCHNFALSEQIYF